MQHPSARANGSPGFAGALLLIVAVFAIVACKAPGALTLPQFWAEDAVVFFVEQRNFGLSSLFVPYAQYLHLVPRLVAQAASWLPAAHVPAAYGWVAYLVSSLALAYFILRLQSPTARVVALGASALALTNGEIYGTLTNVQWFLQLYLVAACLDTRGGRRLPTAVHAGLVLLASLTGPFSVIVAALLGLWALACLLPARGPWLEMLRGHLRQLSRVRLAMLGLGACIQLWYLATRHQPALPALESLPALVQSHLFGKVLLAPVPAVLGLAALLGLLLWQACRARARADHLLVGFVMVMGLLQAWAGHMKLGIPLDVGGGDRYLYSFKLAFWTSLPLLAAEQSRLRLVLVIAVLAALGAVAWKNPQWLARREFADLRWADYAPAIDRNEAVQVPIHPVPWTVDIPARGPAAAIVTHPVP